MRIDKKWAMALAAAHVMCVLTGTHAMAGQDAIRIDMTEGNNDAWANIAMANDDTVETGANIRKSAGTDGEIAGFLYRGGAVYVLNKGDEWSEVTSGNVTGYIRNEYLTFGEEAKGLAEYYGSYGVKASWNDVNIFSDESGDARIIHTAGDGDTFRLIGKNGRWMQLQAGADHTAYVPAEDVSVVMVVDSAVAVDELKDDTEDSVFTEVAGAAQSYGSSDGEASYEEASNVYASEEDGGSTQTYDDAAYASSYEETSYAQEYTEDYSGSSQSGETYTDTSYDAGAGSSQESYTAPEVTTAVNTQGSASDLAAQAQTLYQQYLTAQAAADAAVSSGAGEQAINDTAAAAVTAYNTYLKAQNLADEAAWGVSSQSAQTASSSSDTSYDNAQSSGNTQTQQEYIVPEQDTVDGVSYDTSWQETYDDTSSNDTSSYTEETSSSSDTGSSAGSVSDLELLAALIYCEAGNQPYEGQVAVGAVVMNRVRSGSFPNSIYEVINQSGQFTPSYTGVLAAALANGSGSGYTGAASEAMAGSDPTGGCLYFNNHQGSGLHIGDHWFF